jgi:hypothetical protein
VISDEPLDAFGDAIGLRELLQSSTALANPSKWLDIVFERCLQSLEVSTSLLFVVNPLVDLADHLSLSTKRSTLSQYVVSLKLINIILEIIQCPKKTLISQTNHIRNLENETLSQIIYDKLAARMPSFKAMFLRNRQSDEAKCLIGLISIRLGTNLQSDEDWQLDFNNCVAAAGLHIAVIAASRYLKSRQWALWARDIMLNFCPLSTLNTEKLIKLTVAWCILLELDEVDLDESSQAAKHLSGKKMESIIEYFGEKAKAKAGLHLLGLEIDTVAALTRATDLLIMAFAPQYIRTSVRVTRETVDVVLYPPQAPARISNLRPNDLSILQKEMLTGLAGCSALFRAKSNVWSLWGLPETEAELVALSRLLDPRFGS